MNITLIEALGIGGFILSLVSIGITIVLEIRRTRGRIEVKIKSTKKETGKSRSYLKYEVEIVNKSLEKRYVRAIYQHNLLGRWNLFFVKNHKNKSQIKSWFLKEEFDKYKALERGEALIESYEILYQNHEFSKKVYLKFLVIDSFGKKYRSRGVYIVPSNCEEVSSRGGLLYI